MIFKAVGTPTEHTWPGHTSLPLWQTAQPATHYPPNLKVFLVDTSRKVNTSQCLLTTTFRNHNICGLYTRQQSTHGQGIRASLCGKQLNLLLTTLPTSRLS